MIKVGEYLGLINTRMIKSVRKNVTEYFASKKSFVKRITNNAVKMNRNRIPAAALISLSFRTGMSYPGTFSPNAIILFMWAHLSLMKKKRRFYCKLLINLVNTMVISP